MLRPGENASSWSGPPYLHKNTSRANPPYCAQLSSDAVDWGWPVVVVVAEVMVGVGGGGVVVAEIVVGGVVMIVWQLFLSGKSADRQSFIFLSCFFQFRPEPRKDGCVHYGRPTCDAWLVQFSCSVALNTRIKTSKYKRRNIPSQWSWFLLPVVGRKRQCHLQTRRITYKHIRGKNIT